MLIVIWGTALPVIMNPNRAIAVSVLNVINANLYFFSWLSLAALVFVVGSLARDFTGIQAKDVVSNTKGARYYALAASSVIVMATAVRQYNAGNGCEGASSEGCRRTKWAISLGVVSFVGSVIMAYMIGHGAISKLMDLIVVTILLIMWCFGVGYITFGASPGARIGNLYFSTWISFILVVIMFSSSFRDFMSGGASPSTEEDVREEEEMHDAQQASVPTVPDEEEL